MKKLPNKVDLRKQLKDVPVYNQDGLGSSTACAIAIVHQFEQIKIIKKK